MPERSDRVILDNPKNERIKKVAALSGRSARIKTKTFRVEGLHGVSSLLEHHPQSVKHLFATPEFVASHPELPIENFPHTWVTSAVVNALVRDKSGNVAEPSGANLGSVSPQGVVALAAQVDVPLNQVLRDGAQRLAVFHEIRDPGNAGTILRAADAAGYDAVIFTSGSVDPFSPKVVRSTAGSIFHVPLVVGQDIAELLAALKHSGVKTLAASGYATSSLYELDLSVAHAWIFGNEAHGLPKQVMAACSEGVRIPLQGRAESLNLAMAATLCLFESNRN